MTDRPRDRFAALADCPDCETRTAVADSGYRASALRLCARHRAEEDAANRAAVEASDDLRAIYDLLGRR